MAWYQTPVAAKPGPGPTKFGFKFNKYDDDKLVVCTITGRNHFRNNILNIITLVCTIGQFPIDSFSLTHSH